MLDKGTRRKDREKKLYKDKFIYKRTAQMVGVHEMKIKTFSRTDGYLERK